MGRGCARETRDRFRGLDQKLGRLLREHGNRPMRLRALSDGSHLGSFPVKRHWKEQADLDLIGRSARRLVELVEKFGYTQVLLPKPGCGNGRLSWSVVKPRIEAVLDERFIMVHL